MNFEKIIDGYRGDIIKSTQEIIRIKSVEEKPKEGMPFGEGPYKALKYALDLSEKLGFKTENFDGYAGHADLGEGDEIVGILVHLDVVPEGDGWTYPPYEAQIHDDKIYGRGAIDDKGPTIASLYAMKALKDSDVLLDKKIRIIFGTNEESGWGGVKYYFNKVKAPDMAFTPDAEFPVIHGEKGIIVFDIIKKLNDDNNDIVIINIKGGNAANMVPDTATVELKVSKERKNEVLNILHDAIKTKGYKASITDNKETIEIKVEGVSAHGSMPHLGINAISQLLDLLGEIKGESSSIFKFINTYNEKIGMEYYGKSIGCGFEDDESGKLTFNVGVINIEDGKVKVTINVRYPISYSEDDVYKGIRDELKDTEIEVIEGVNMKPIYTPKNHPLVSKLMKVYREVTGDEDSEPITIGGGTYARAMDNAVAFGPLFPGQEELAHQKDEHISTEDLIKNCKIYAKALYELAK